LALSHWTSYFTIVAKEKEKNYQKLRNSSKRENWLFIL
jgi:hypothetical protein